MTLYTLLSPVSFVSSFVSFDPLITPVLISSSSRIITNCLFSVSDLSPSPSSVSLSLSLLYHAHRWRLLFFFLSFFVTLFSSSLFLLPSFHLLFIFYSSLSPIHNVSAISIPCQVQVTVHLGWPGHRSAAPVVSYLVHNLAGRVYWKPSLGTACSPTTTGRPCACTNTRAARTGRPRICMYQASLSSPFCCLRFVSFTLSLIVILTLPALFSHTTDPSTYLPPRHPSIPRAASQGRHPPARCRGLARRRGRLPTPPAAAPPGQEPRSAARAARRP